MCELCGPDGNIYYDPISDDWYLSLPTDAWDEYEDDFVYIKEYINYCPYCGRELRPNVSA